MRANKQARLFTLKYLYIGVSRASTAKLWGDAFLQRALIFPGWKNSRLAWKLRNRINDVFSFCSYFERQLRETSYPWIKLQLFDSRSRNFITCLWKLVMIISGANAAVHSIAVDLMFMIRISISNFEICTGNANGACTIYKYCIFDHIIRVFEVHFLKKIRANLFNLEFQALK